MSDIFLYISLFPLNLIKKKSAHETHRKHLEAWLIQFIYVVIIQWNFIKINLYFSNPSLCINKILLFLSHQYFLSPIKIIFILPMSSLIPLYWKNMFLSEKGFHKNIQRENTYEIFIYLSFKILEKIIGTFSKLCNLLSEIIFYKILAILSFTDQVHYLFFKNWKNDGYRVGVVIYSIKN